MSGDLYQQATSRWRVLNSLGLQLQNAYAVLDAARDERILPLLKNSPGEWECLYSGSPAISLAAYAPYLWKVTACPLISTLMTTAWGQSWGIFVTSDARFDKVRLQLKKSLILNNAGNRQAYYRFYDPRALRVTLPAFFSYQKTFFFGDVLSAVYCEGPSGTSVQRYTLQRNLLINKLEVEERPLTP